MVCLVNSLLIWFPQRHMFPAAVRSVQSGLGYALVGRAWIGKQASALRTKQTTLSGHAPTLRVALQGSVQVTCFRCYRTSCAPVVLGPHASHSGPAPPPYIIYAKAVVPKHVLRGSNECAVRRECQPHPQPISCRRTCFSSFHAYMYNLCRGRKHFLYTRENIYFISPQSTPSLNTLCAAVTVLLLYLLGQLHNVLKVHVMQ